MKPHIFIVDDEPLYLRSLSRSLSSDYNVTTFESGKEFFKAFKSDEVRQDVVLLDYSLRELTAEEIIPTLVQHDPSVKIILVSGQADVDDVIKCVRLGAYDYMEKPVVLDSLRIKINNAVAMLQIERDRQRFQTRKLQRYSLVGDSRPMQELRYSIQQVARTEATVLIHGESGTGKELVAHQLHYNSPRSGNPMQIINCAAISKELAGSMLFGHVRGAFTGAISDSTGHVELADNGTLFLDEIGDMPLDIQAQLLRFLETGEFHRIGETTIRTTDVRIIAATNRDIAEMVKSGEFRQDLYYRLNVYSIRTPALREHPVDIPQLVDHFLQKRVMEGGGPARVFSEEALQMMISQPWPGNIRELKHFVDKAIILVDKEAIDKADVADLLAKSNETAIAHADDTTATLEALMAATERNAIITRLQLFEGDVSSTAKSLGLHRSNLYRKAARYDIDLRNYSKN